MAPASSTPFQSLESTPLKLESAPHRETLHRSQLFWFIPAAFSVLYLILGGTTVGWHRLGTHWSMTITAVFASLIAGASPEGGSSVFFPVLTVILDVSPAIGRSFGLCIQTIGMSVASLRILITGIPVDWNVIFLALPSAAVTQVTVLFISPDRTMDAAFLPPFVNAAYVQATFAIIVFTMATISALMLFTSAAEGALPMVTPWNVRRIFALVIAAAGGGVLSAVSASGANLLVYLLMVACFDVSPKVAVPTTVIITSTLSLLGVIVLAAYGQQFDVTVNASSHLVYQVGDLQVIPPCPVASCDLPGLLLAAAPVVVWGAPAGAEIIAHVSDRYVVGIVIVICISSIVGIFSFVDDLHAATPLLAYTLTGMGLSFSLTMLLRVFRHPLFGGDDCCGRNMSI